MGVECEISSDRRKQIRTLKKVRDRLQRRAHPPEIPEIQLVVTECPRHVCREVKRERITPDDGKDREPDGRSQMSSRCRHVQNARPTLNVSGILMPAFSVARLPFEKCLMLTSTFMCRPLPMKTPMPMES